jgi:pimeloyl-ACP methyl ester carboxylesterase
MRRLEKRLNAYEQFRTEIDGVAIHLLHVRSPHANALPLIMTHGWPGSVVEFLGSIRALTEPEDPNDAFHLVLPSIPGYGFSDKPMQTGWGVPHVAAAWAKLMARLGYSRYGAQGGDWGAFVGPELGRSDAEHVIGVHVNAATFGFIPFGELSEEEQSELSEGEKVRYARLRNWDENLSGYFKIQATRPQTLAYAMTDSPVGLAAWIGDWFRDRQIEIDRVLADITIYWLTNTFASSILQYYEDMHSGNWPSFSTTPTGVANFGDDVAIRGYAEQLNTIVHWSEFDAGNHFAAMSVPELLLEDVRAFFGTLR